jgi:hypothetical protein
VDARRRPSFVKASTIVRASLAGTLSSAVPCTTKVGTCARLAASSNVREAPSAACHSSRNSPCGRDP